MEEFYRHPQMLDGRLNQCKGCKKSYQRKYSASPQGRANDKRKYERNKEKILARNAAYQEKHKERLRVYKQKWQRENAEAISAKQRDWYAENHEKVLARVSQYNQSERGKAAKNRYEANNPEKVKARRVLLQAIRRGKISRGACEVCGNLGQAHHDDYSKPFDVRWLCFRHHREIAHGQVTVSA